MNLLFFFNFIRYNINKIPEKEWIYEETIEHIQNNEDPKEIDYYALNFVFKKFVRYLDKSLTWTELFEEKKLYYLINTIIGNETLSQKFIEFAGNCRVEIFNEKRNAYKKFKLEEIVRITIEKILYHIKSFYEIIENVETEQILFGSYYSANNTKKSILFFLDSNDYNQMAISDMKFLISKKNKIFILGSAKFEPLIPEMKEIPFTAEQELIMMEIESKKDEFYEFLKTIPTDINTMNFNRDNIMNVIRNHEESLKKSEEILANIDMLNIKNQLIVDKIFLEIAQVKEERERYRILFELSRSKITDYKDIMDKFKNYALGVYEILKNKNIETGYRLVNIISVKESINAEIEEKMVKFLILFEPFVNYFKKLENEREEWFNIELTRKKIAEVEKFINGDVKIFLIEFEKLFIGYKKDLITFDMSLSDYYRNLLAERGYVLRDIIKY